MIIGSDEQLAIGAASKGIYDQHRTWHPHMPFVVLSEVTEQAWVESCLVDGTTPAQIERTLAGAPAARWFYDVSVD